MSKHLFIINDEGNAYSITGTRLEMDDSFVVDPALYYETSKEDFFYVVKDMLDGNNDVRFLKNIDQAKLNVNLTDASFLVVSQTTGVEGNNITFGLTDPGDVDQPLTITVSSNDINVSLATDSEGAISSTIIDVVNAINADVDAFALVEATLILGTNELVEAFATTNLTGGDGTELDSNDLIVTTLDALTVQKARARTKGKHLLKQYCDFTLQFDFFEFAILNNKFIDAGYVITDENREAKYLDIINTDDADLISDLDLYLECRDRIAVSNHNYANYITFKSNVNDAANETEVDEAYAAFALLYN